MKRRSLAAVVLCLACAPRMAQAQLVITEIMYDPLGADSGHEWIEVYNASGTPSTLAKYKLHVSDANHNIIAVATSTLAARSYAVIAANAAKFAADHPDYTGALFHSSFSLDNAGATIAIVAPAHASSTALARATYDSAEGALADGNSLQRLDDAASFVPRTPTPGGVMAGTAIAPRPDSSRAPSPAKKTSKHSSTSVADTEHSDAVSETARTIRRSSADPAAAAVPAPRHPWWLGALALAIAACAVIYALSRSKRSEWDIVDESGKGV